MKRLTAKRVNGIKRGYWSGARFGIKKGESLWTGKV